MSSGPTPYELGLHAWDSLDRARGFLEELRDHPKAVPADVLDSVFLLWAIETARTGLPGKVAGGPGMQRIQVLRHRIALAIQAHSFGFRTFLPVAEQVDPTEGDA